MNKKKEKLLHKGARVRVAAPGANGDDRWQNALAGVVAETPQSWGVQVLVDGEAVTRHVDWSDIDVERKPRHTWLELPLTEIRPSRWQYRRTWDPDKLLDLAKSIREHGLINRLLVFRHEDGQHYELIAGERRYRALAALALTEWSLPNAIGVVSAADWWDHPTPSAGLTEATAPCELRDGTADQFREIVILENLQREDPSPVEEAEGFRILMEEEGYTQATLAKRLGKSQAYVSQRMGLLGLADEVREATEEGDLSFAAARAIATLPALVQSAVTEHVQKLASAEGDAQVTTRKVQNMTRQIRTFLDPETWVPAEDEIITPDTRNRLRLIQHSVRSVAPERAGEAVVALRAENRFGGAENYTGKKPLSIARDDHMTSVVCSQLTTDGPVDRWRFNIKLWRALAMTHGWTCMSCQFSSARPPNEFGFDELCKRWRMAREGEDWEEEAPVTCLCFIGDTDPVVLSPLDYEFDRWLEKLEIKPAGEVFGRTFLDSFEQLASAHERIAQAKAEEIKERDREEQEAHLPALREYWTAQCDDDRALVARHAAGEPGRALDTSHAQAHNCRMCQNHRPDLRSQDLPPCRFAVEPLRVNNWSTRTKAPEMGVLVRSDGWMVPRCLGFQYGAVPTIAPASGFRFPSTKTGRSLVLDWLRKLATAKEYHSNRSGTLSFALAWLPVERGEDPTLSEYLVRLARYVRDHWDELGGDQAVARLMSVALTEATARNAQLKKFDLMNAVTGELERWVPISWDAYASGKLPRYGHDYPDDWPKPWMREE